MTGVQTCALPIFLNGVAVDPELIPYGTIVKIPGFGFKVADDTGNRMKQNAKKGFYHIDVRTLSYRKALRFGRKIMPIKLYRPR